MKNILLLIFIMVLSLNFELIAQERSVSGKIVDDSGGPIPGVSILVKGTTQGVISDIDGNFKLEIPSNDAVLVFSFIGMKTIELEVGARSYFDVVLQEDIETLSEVVVVAYGEQSKKTLTGALSQIDNTVIENQQIVTVGRALQGTVPGVNVISSSGQPGANSTINIRGIGSINSSTNPLIVVDGAVFSGNLNNIDPRSIESISVLKDASATALYGSRAGNGVVLVKTKRGKVGEARINLQVSAGVSERAVKEYEFVDAGTLLQLEWETLFNQGRELQAGDPTVNPGQFATDGLIQRVGYNPYGVANPIGPDGNVIDGAELLWNTDWEDALTRQASRRDVSLGISGGTDKVKYFIGGSLLDQEGIVIESDFTRLSGRLNLDVQFNDWLSGGLRQSITSSEQNNPTQAGNAFSNTIQYIRTVSSIYPIYRRDENGAFVRDNDGNLIFDTGDTDGQAVNGRRPVLSPSNVVAQTQLNESLAKRFFSTTNAFFQVDFLENFAFKTSYTLNKNLFNNFAFTNQQIGAARTVRGRVARTRNINTEYTWTNSLNFSKKYDDHGLDVLLLQELYDFEVEALNGSSTGLPFDGLFEFNSAASIESLNGFTNQERISSLLGRVKYNYKGKYFAEVSYRRDKSSRFSPAQRTGNFFSGAVSWILSDEGFLKGNDAISFLKFRASAGENGNNRIQNAGVQDFFPYLTTFNTGFDQLDQSGVYIGPLRNENITWEGITTFNLGLDFGLFKDKLTGTVEVYDKITTDLILARPLTNSLGARGNSILENTGRVSNKGIEVSLNSQVYQAKDFAISVGVNVAFQKNEIKEFPQDELLIGSRNLQVGRSIFDFFIEDYAGVDPQTGQPLWYKDVEDADGNVTGRETTNVYGEADRYFVGSSLPWAIGGFNTNITYKNFDLSALLNFSVGAKILDFDYAGLVHGGLRPGQQASIDVLDRWQNPGDITDVPRLHPDDRGNSRSTRFLFNNDYLRVRNITLGYTIPTSILNRTGFIKSFRVFVQGDNLFTFSGRDGLDPEQNIAGTTNNRSAVFKTMSAGINVNF